MHIAENQIRRPDAKLLRQQRRACELTHRSCRMWIETLFIQMVVVVVVASVVVVGGDGAVVGVAAAADVEYFLC